MSGRSIDPRVARDLREILTWERRLERSDDAMGAGYSLLSRAHERLARRGADAAPSLIAIVASDRSTPYRRAAARALERLAWTDAVDAPRKSEARSVLERAGGDPCEEVAQSARRALAAISSSAGDADE